MINFITLFLYIGIINVKCNIIEMKRFKKPYFAQKYGEYSKNT